MNMARYEQETIISFNEEEKTAGIYTHNKILRQKLAALARDRPEDCRLVKVSHSGRAVDYTKRNSPSARLNSLQLTTGDSAPKKRDRASESHDRKTGMIKSNIPNKWLGIFPIVHPSFIAYIMSMQ